MPTSGRECYRATAFSGIPIKGGKLRSCYIPLAFSGGHDWRKCYIPTTFAMVAMEWHKIRAGYITDDFSGAHGLVEPLRSRGSQSKGTNRSGCITLAF